VTTPFRLESVRIETVNGPFVIEFPAHLTVLAGATGVGKTTLLELIKFGLGGDGLLAPVVETSVSEVHLDVQVGRSRFALSRPISEKGRKHVRVVDLVSGDRLPDRAVDNNQENSISDLLMTALGLPTDMRAAPRGKNSSSKGHRITFNDVFKYMYVSQAAINQEIAGSGDNYYEPKRRAVFELLFGLTRPEILDLQSRLNELNRQVAEANREYETVHRFLADSKTASRLDSEAAQAAAAAEEREAHAELRALTTQLGDAVDRETQALRDLLTASERSEAEARELVVELGREAREYRQERRRVEQDVARFDRMANAGERLANIEFVVCPRCTQSLTQRFVSAGACRVCLQPDIVPDLPQGSYERAS
jgi:flagellar biosynthesis GTPase FlhF